MLHVTTRDIPAIGIHRGCPLHAQPDRTMVTVAPPHTLVMLTVPHVVRMLCHPSLHLGVCEQGQIDFKMAHAHEHQLLDTRGNVVFGDVARRTVHKTYCGNTFLGVIRGTWELVECTHPPPDAGVSGWLYVRRRLWDGYTLVIGSDRVNVGDVVPLHLPNRRSWVVSWPVAPRWSDHEGINPDDPPPPHDAECTLDEPCSAEALCAWDQYTPSPPVVGP